MHCSDEYVVSGKSTLSSEPDTTSLPLERRELMRLRLSGLERPQRRPSQSFPEPDRLVGEPGITSLPSGEKATDVTESQLP